MKTGSNMFLLNQEENNTLMRTLKLKKYYEEIWIAQAFVTLIQRRLNFFYIINKNSFPTSQRIHSVSIILTNR